MECFFVHLIKLSATATPNPQIRELEDDLEQVKKERRVANEKALLAESQLRQLQDTHRATQLQLETDKEELEFLQKKVSEVREDARQAQENFVRTHCGSFSSPAGFPFHQECRGFILLTQIAYSSGFVLPPADPAHECTGILPPRATHGIEGASLAGERGLDCKSSECTVTTGKTN